MNFEEKLKKLTEQRKKLNSSESFDEILKVWNDLKSNFNDCKKELSSITSQMNQNDESLKINDEDLTFEKAFSEIKSIAEKVKVTSVTELPSLIKRMQVLKSFCLEKLEEEKAKVEEQKL